MSRALFHTWSNIHENAPVCFHPKMPRTKVHYLIPSPLNVKLTLSGGKLIISICRRPLTAALVCLVWRLVLINNKRPYTSYVLHGVPESYRPIPSSKTLTFKMRPSAQPFLWKRVLFAREYHFDSKADHLTSFWYRGSGNSEMAYWLMGDSLRNLLNLVLVHFPASTLPARAFICRWFYEPISGYLRTSFRRAFPSNRRFFNEIVAYQELFCVVTLLSELERATTTTTKETRTYKKQQVSNQSRFPRVTVCFDRCKKFHVLKERRCIHPKCFSFSLTWSISGPILAVLIHSLQRPALFRFAMPAGM